MWKQCLRFWSEVIILKIDGHFGVLKINIHVMISYCLSGNLSVSSSLHRWLRPSKAAVPGIFRAGGVRGPCNSVRLGEPSVVQQVGHQSEGVSLRRTRRLHHPRGRGGRRLGNRSHHLHPHVHHHSPQWVSAVHIAFIHWHLTTYRHVTHTHIHQAKS